MPINLTKLNTKLEAIRAKDVDSIVANHVYIPFMGNNYTKEQLQAWLDKRINILVLLSTLTDIRALREYNDRYDLLTAKQKLQAAKFLLGELVEDLDSGTYERLVELSLIKFVRE